MRRIAAIGLLSLATVACGRQEPVPFPAGLEPLEVNKAEFPEDGSQTLVLASGQGEEWDWSHGRGYVHAPLAETWAALQEPEVDVDRRRVDTWEATFDVEPDYDPSYRIDQTVVDIVTVQYSVTWRHGLVDEGVAAVRWQKTDGSGLVELLEGSIVLTDQGEATGFEVVEHLATPATDDVATMEQYLGDLFASVVAHTSGEALPTYE